MGGISFSVHPLFFVFGMYYAVTGRIFVFVVYTICAVIHELGHSFVASGLGYKLNKITLMPFGAVVSGNIEGLKLKDQIKIAMAGPFINLAIGLFFVAVWWIYPEFYAFTDIVAEANFSLALINFIPVFPLDGGRILWAFLGERVGKKKADVTIKIIGLIFVVLLFSAFIVTIFYSPNISLLFFAFFAFSGLVGKSKENKYVKVATSLSEDKLMRGIPVLRQAISKNATIKKLLSLVDDTCLNEIVVYDNGKPIIVLSQEKIQKIIETGEIYAKIEKYLSV